MCDAYGVQGSAEFAAERQLTLPRASLPSTCYLQLATEDERRHGGEEEQESGEKHQLGRRCAPIKRTTHNGVSRGKFLYVGQIFDVPKRRRTIIVPLHGRSFAASTMKSNGSSAPHDSTRALATFTVTDPD